MLITLLLCSSLLVFAVRKESQSSYLDQTLFSTKTPYKLARHWFSDYVSASGVRSQPLPDISKEQFYPPQCTPSQLSMVLRHGTRFPSSGDIKRTAALLAKLEDMELKDEYLAIKGWHNDFTKDNEKQLAGNGAQENIEIAKRLVKAFPELFKSSLALDTDNFEMMSSNTQRSIDSAKAFSKGLSHSLSGVEEEWIFSKLSLRNDLMRFFEQCKEYNYQVEANEDVAMAEFDKFRYGPEIREAARKVSQRIAKDGGADHITADDLRSIWVICGFETALRSEDHSSPWCDLISKEESKVLEYTFDLKAFWKKSYGYTLNYEQSCPLLSDIMNNIHQAHSDDSAPGVSLYFGHAETVLPLLSLIGLFQDDVPLRSDNYLHHKDTRKFRTSFVTPFTTNLALVAYTCEEGPQDTHPDWPEYLNKHMVQVIMNEHPVPFPFTDKLAVDLHVFGTHYYQFLHHCDFNGMCKNDIGEPEDGHTEL